MAIATQLNTVGFDGTYVYGTGSLGFSQRNATTLANINTVNAAGFTNSIGYMPFDGTYMYAPSTYGIAKIEVSTMTVVAVYPDVSGEQVSVITYDGTYLYINLYNTTSSSYTYLLQINPATMRLVQSLQLTNVLNVLAPSLKNAVSPIL